MSKTEKSEQDQSAYTVLARKYRPSNFEELIGQRAMVQTLANAFRLGRIAQGFMLTGVRGVGKTTTARILARALNYEGDGQDGPTIDMPDMGPHCQAIMESRHVDVLEMDAASHTGVDDIREIIESTRYKPISARYKVYIIDEVHMLSKSAFNALLKTLEEPPGHVKFIFATTEVQKVPVTVLSRCQRFDLKRVEMDELAAHFGSISDQEGVKVDEEALMLIARAAEGSVRDGLSVLDQAIAHANDKVEVEDVRALLGLADRMRIFDLLASLLEGDAAQAITRCEALYMDGAEPSRILVDLAETVHIITRQKIVDGRGARSLSQAERERVAEMAEPLSTALLSRCWQMLLKGIDECAKAPNQIMAVEMVLIRIAYAAELPSPEELARVLSAPNAAPPALSPNQGATTASTTGHGERIGAGQQTLRRMPDGGGPQAAAVPFAENELDSPPSGPANFEELAKIMGDAGGLMLKIAFEEHVRPVKFAQGAVEIALAQDAPRGLANDIKRVLHEATGENWIVAISETGGGKTLAETSARLKAQELEAVSQHPLVKEALKQFPGAKIADVRAIKNEQQD